MKGRKLWMAALLFLLLCLGGAVSVQAANVPASRAEVSVKSAPGWKQVGKHWYYYSKQGRLQSGQIRDGGQVYYCLPSGRMVTGWYLHTNKKWYYFQSSGAMVRDMIKTIQGKRYCFNRGGVMLTGWQKVKNIWYYFGSDGAAYRGWKTVAGKKYYFDSWGRMAADQWLKYQNNWYYVGADGAQYRSKWLYKGGAWYYLSIGGKMVTGWNKIDGKKYYFYQSGKMAASTWIGNYYVGADGAMVDKNWQNASGTELIYSSSNLHIEVKKTQKNGHPYWLARVRTGSGKQLKSALSYGTYGGTRQTTSSAVKANGGVLGVNGSAFDYGSGKPSPLGMCIKNGKVYGNYATSYTVFAVKEDGTMFTPPQGLWADALLKMGVKDTYNFGPVLINEGRAQPAIAETNKQYPRTAVGMVKKNDYVLLVTDNGYSGLNHWEMVNIFQAFGCQYAYNLDGGGSSTMVFNGRVLNRPAAGAERPCADYLFFTR